MTDNISLIGLTVALLLPWGLGCIVIQRLLTHSNQPSNGFVVTGAGYFVGLFITTLIIRLWDAANLELNFWYIASLLCAMCVFGLAMRGNRKPLRKDTTRGFAELPHWQIAVMAILIALIVWRQVTLIQELSIRPMWGWDAWMNWAPKAIVWWHNGELVNYISTEQWLLQPPSESNHTLGNYRAWAYPPTVPLILLWNMMGAGTWDHTLLYLPWILGSVNLGVALYGHLRLAGSTMLAAVIAGYFLLNMPFLNVHSAVAGYADIWLGATFGLAVFALHEWAKYRHWSWGLLCIFFAIMCSQLKIPGIVLSAIVLVAVIRSLLNLRWKTELATFALIVGGISGAIVWGFDLEIPYLGNISVQGRAITTPLFGYFEMEYHPVSEAFIRSLLLSINWNFLWCLPLPVLLLKLRNGAFFMPASNELFALMMVGVFTILVFFFTETYANALDHTTLSRALIYPVPALIFYLFLGLLPAKESASGSYL